MMRYPRNTDLRIKRTDTDQIGTNVRLEQTYAGLPVLGGEAIVQLDPAGNVSSIAICAITATVTSRASSSRTESWTSNTSAIACPPFSISALIMS
ncbi:MAG: hypothetical protein HZB26_14245 [Candidatus Hydrogenedentes bacterium]|nr:hypothetical protein [Candidatus Hydrogenedentota bacterium]